MKNKTVLVVPDSYKGCLTSRQAGEAMARGIERAGKGIKAVRFTASDGGEGFCDCMRELFGGELVSREVTYPDRSRGVASYLWCEESKTAYIELAAASGLTLVPPEARDPLKTTTIGTGELIADAAARGAKKIIVGLGGSATNDCGAGILYALGCRFYGAQCDEIFPCGGSLAIIKSADLSALDNYRGIEFTAACDVTNPLCGTNGAAYVFAPQKGARAEDLTLLDAGAESFAKFAGINKDLPGSGAAGGCGGTLLSLFDASFISGAELLAGSQPFVSALKNCRAVFTGEGRTDSQTARGKLASVIAAKAKEYGKPVIIVSGALEDCRELYALGVTACFSIAPRPMDLSEAFAEAEANITCTTENAARIIFAE